MGGLQYCLRWAAVIAVAALGVTWAAGALPGTELTVEEMKARLASANLRDRPRLCMQIARRQLAETDRDYAAGEIEQAQAPLGDVVTFSEQARDYAIKSHKYQKQTEIAVRGMTRKLTDILHSLPREEQGPVRDAISRLQKVRDDLLAAMFPKGTK
jgi:hypothetical protein